MPSPFPGMNPYLEQEGVWQGFHAKFLAALGERLVPQVRPNYIVELEEHLYVHELPAEPRRLLGRADVSLAKAPEKAGPTRGGITATEAPAQVRLMARDVERVPYLELRDRRHRELVTVIELLTPSNKRPGPDREGYLLKRDEVLISPAHLVEIDLLRGGRPMPLEDRPDCLYSVLISRAEDRPEAGFWPIGLREPLPEIPVSLRPSDPDARIDLQRILHHVHDAWGYEDFIYDSQPDPPLGPEDAAWAATLIPPRNTAEAD